MWTVTVGGSSAGLNPGVVQAFAAAVRIVANYFDRYIDTTGVSIDIRLEFPTADSFDLWTTDRYLDHSADGVNYFAPAPFVELTTGIDPNGSAPDIVINTNHELFRLNARTSYFEPSDNYGLTTGLSWGRLFDTIWHALGIDSFYFDAGPDRTVFDEFLVLDAHGNPNFVTPGLSRELHHPSSAPPPDWVHFADANEFGYLSIQDLSVYAALGLPLRPGPSGSGDRLYSVLDDGAYQNAPLNGLGGNDTIYGVFLDDLLSGGVGRDRIFGLYDDDSLWGNAGNDKLFGGQGDDLLNGGPGADRIDGEDNPESSFKPGDVVDYSTSPAAVNVTIDGPVFGGDAAGDVLINIESVWGSNFGDSLFGDDAWNALRGNKGADFIDGGAGDDTLSGDETDFPYYLDNDGARDTLIGGPGADKIDTEPNDVLSYRTSTSGVHVEFHSLIYPRGKFIDGGDATGDVIDGEARIIEGSEFADTIRGNPGSDSNLSTIGSELYGLGGNDILYGVDAPAPPYASSISDTLYGGAGNDTLDGGNAADLLLGGLGRDQILGRDGDDSLYGGAKRDSIIGGNGVDLVAGGGKGDIIDGGAEGDFLFGAGGNDDIQNSDGDDRAGGGAGRDSISGDAGKDTLDGGVGDDTIAGGDGSDLLISGSGADVIEYAELDDVDVIIDFTPGAGPGDLIRLIGFGAVFDTFEEVIAAASDDGVSTTINFGGGDVLILKGVVVSELSTDDFVFG